MADDPIEPQEYLSGTTVVDMGDLRVARGMTRRPYSICRHIHLVYDPHERRIWCQDCEKDVDAFDAFVGLIDSYAQAVGKLKRDREELEIAKTFAIRNLATRTLDKAWSKRNSVPMCPHCKAGLFPQDFKTGVAEMGREYAQAQHDRRNKK